jgi:hypothetical protein
LCFLAVLACEQLGDVPFKLPTVHISDIINPAQIKLRGTASVILRLASRALSVLRPNA